MGIITFENVTKRYKDKVVFEQLCFNAEEGDFWAVEGSSGTGKSTFLNIMGLLDTPSSGVVTVCGIKNPKPNTKIWRKLLRENISYLFQNYGLIEGESVRKNLMISAHFLNLSKKDKDDLFREVLQSVGLHNVLDKTVFQLSGGEQQRVALAKCIIKDTDIILADEPTGNVDRKNTNKIMDIFSHLNERGKTIILVTHDGEVAKCAKKRIEL